MDELRRPLFLLALGVILCVILIELGSPWLIEATNRSFDQPGYGIQYLFLVDAFLLYVSILIGLALIVPERIQGRLQAVSTLIISFFGCFGIIVAIILALVFLLLLVSLLLSPIFGTAVYAAVYGDFDRTGANVTHGLVITLKILFAILLVLAHQRFLQNKSLVLLTLTSLVSSLIISFLHNFPPLIFMSITDAFGAIIVGILALIWSIVFLVGSIVALVKSVH